VDALNRGDWKGLEVSLAPGSVYEEFGSQRRFEGSTAILAAFQEWKAALPDLKAVLSTTYQEGDRVALELTWQGTHSGALQSSGATLEPSGNRLALPWVMTIDVNNGKIKGIRSYFDTMSLRKQLGAPVGQASPS
jgi:steroid delta-isomerase-like uncharacterized protein